MGTYEELIIEKYGLTLNRKEAAEILKVSIPTLDRFMRDNIIKFRKIGHGISILPKTLVVYMGME